MRAHTKLIGLLAVVTSAFAAGDTLPDFVVGRNLQAFGSIKLDKPAPAQGLALTIASDDPKRVLFSRNPETPGTESITFKLNPIARETPDLWVSASGEPGEVTYTVSAPGLEPKKGKVLITRSAILISGPYQAPMFRTTPQGAPSKIVVYPVRLDDAGNPVEKQAIGAKPVEVELISSQPSVGSLNISKVRLRTGAPNTIVEFQPASLGETVLQASVPDGFSEPAQPGTIQAIVALPGIGLSNELVIGQNLQTGGLVGLGQVAGPGGVRVTVTSSDPSRLLISSKEDQQGSGSAEILIPEGKVNAPVILQALGDSGSVIYTASAPGFLDREATAILVPSGVVITPSPYGPPDEGALDSKHPFAATGFVTSLTKPSKVPISIWTAYLDPASNRAADITVQPLRAGMSLKVRLQSSDPAIGTIEETLAISGGGFHAETPFHPKSAGTVSVSVVTPNGFTQPSNSTSLKVIVKE
jgi:hypothetical protein